MDELLTSISKINILTAEIYSNLINTYGESMVKRVLDEMISLPNVDLRKYEYYISRITSYDDVVLTDSFSAYSLDLDECPTLTVEESKKRVIEIHNIVLELNELIKCVDSSISSVWIADRVDECIKVCNDKELLKKIKKLYDKFVYKRNELMEGNLKLVISFAKFFYKHGTDFNELIQYGNIGLMKAIEKYDPKFNTTLSTYAYYWIKQVITREMSTLINPAVIPYHYTALNMSINKAIKNLTFQYNRDPSDEEIAKYLNISLKTVRKIRGLFTQSVSLDDCVFCDDNDLTLVDTIEDKNSNTEEMVIKKLLSFEVVKYLNDHLTDREYDIICHRFEINGYEFMTLEQLALQYGITREYVRQIEKRVKMRIKRSVKLRNYYK